MLVNENIACFGDDLERLLNFLKFADFDWGIPVVSLGDFPINAAPHF